MTTVWGKEGNGVQNDREAFLERVVREGVVQAKI